MSLLMIMKKIELFLIFFKKKRKKRKKRKKEKKEKKEKKGVPKITTLLKKKKR